MSTQSLPQPGVENTPAVAASRIISRSMCLSINRGWPPLMKTVSSTAPQINTTAARNRVHVQKDLFNSPDLRKLFNAHNKLDIWLTARCMPFPLKPSMYLMSKDIFNEVEGRLADYEANVLPPLVDAVVANYQAEIDKARAELGDMFNEADYLSAEQFKARFRFKWNYLQFGVDEALREISAQTLEREQAKLDEEILEAGAEMRKVLRLEWQSMIDFMLDKLEPGEDGKKKVFRAGQYLDKVKEAFTLFSARNSLAEDTSLATLVNQARQLLDGVSPDQLKDDAAIRANIQSGFAQIKQGLDHLVEEEPDRSIRFD